MRKVKIKKKCWVWKLALCWNHQYTAIKDTIYYKKTPPSARVQRHERMHLRQQERVGLLKYLLLYGFALPFWYNPWRWKWEYAAYTKGSGWSHASTVKMLRSKSYGWLRHE